MPEERPTKNERAPRSATAVDEAAWGSLDSIEQGIARLWATLLGLEHVDVQANLLFLGGESLLATQAQSRLRDLFQCEVELRTVLLSSVKEIAEEVWRTIDHRRGGVIDGQEA